MNLLFPLFLLLFWSPGIEFKPTDLSRLKDIGDLQISPDGARIVFTVSEASPDRSHTITRLFITDPGGKTRQINDGDFNTVNPRWSPDGQSIAFYSNRDGTDAIWVVPAEGGEPRMVTHVQRSSNFITHLGETLDWSPDGKRIAFISSPEILSMGRWQRTEAKKVPGVPEEVLRPLTREEIETRLPSEIREMIFRMQSQSMGQKPANLLESTLSSLPDDPRVISRLQYKSRTAFSDTIQSHIFTVDVVTGELRQITTGIYSEHSIDWSPVGDEILFVSNRQPDPDRVNNTDLYAVNINNFTIRQLTTTPGCEWQPRFSPDGSKIGYLATRREVTSIDSVAEDTQAYLMTASGGEAIPISYESKRRVNGLGWSPDGSALLFLLNDHGRTSLWMRQISKMGTAPALYPLFDRPAQITAWSIGQNGTIAAVISEPDSPAEIFLGEITGAGYIEGTFRRHTSINARLRVESHFINYKPFEFVSDGLNLEGWLAFPPDMKGDQKVPTILLVHGGPHGMHGYSFNPTVQQLAANGYAVLLINPRGSSGYGQIIADGSLNDWGGGDFRDLMKGLDTALALFQTLDGTRLGVMGASYGGYMTNWIITKTNRFRAGISIAGLSNLISFYSTSLYQDLIHAEFNGYPWERYDLLWDRSPLKYVANMKTPLLLIHGEQDNDVHITQAEEIYTSARMLGIETIFVRYPREGHSIREPRHREDLAARQILWFNNHLAR